MSVFASVAEAFALTLHSHRFAALRERAAHLEHSEMQRSQRIRELHELHRHTMAIIAGPDAQAVMASLAATSSSERPIK